MNFIYKRYNTGTLMTSKPSPRSLNKVERKPRDCLAKENLVKPF